MVDLAASVWRDFVTDGVPASGANKPSKSKVRAWGAYLESLHLGSGLVYTFSSTTTDADPGAGTFRLNNATVSSATSAYFDNEDGTGIDVSGIIDGWDNSTNTVRGSLTIRSVGDPDVVRVFNVSGSVVDGTGYRKVTITHVGGAGALVEGDEYTFVFSRSGDFGNFPGYTADGTVPTREGFFKDVDPDTQIHRLRDRVFFGDGVMYTGNQLGANGYGGSWLTEKGASYFEKNSQVTVLGDESVHRYGLLGAAIGPSAIGIAAVAVNEDGAGGRALYAEVFHKSTASNSTGVEIQVGNYTVTDVTPNAYAMSGVRGLMVAPEGGNGYTVGDADTAVTPAALPAAAAIDIAGGSLSSAAQRFRVGLVFRNGSLYRGAGGTSGVAKAISLAQQHGVVWEASSTIVGAQIRSDVTAVSGQDVALIFANTQVTIGGTGERAIAVFKDDTSGSGAVNYLQIANSRTGIPNAIRAKGTDTDIGVDISAVGIGVIRFQSHDGSGEHFRVAPASQAINYAAATGGTTGINPRLAAAGSDTNLSLILRGKGTGGVRAENASATALFETTSTGIGFFAATPVARGALAAPSGTITRTTFATSSVTLPQLAERVYAMINDLRAYGLFS